mgnify:CR=1 FL=1
MRKLVIIPTYNEKENISAMIDKVFSLPEPFEMLVIDDGSPDGTAAIVGVCPRSNYIIRRSPNLSKESHIIAANVDQAFLVVSLYLSLIHI